MSRYTGDVDDAKTLVGCVILVWLAAKLLFGLVP